MDIEALAIVFALHIEEWKYFNSCSLGILYICLPALYITTLTMGIITALKIVSDIAPVHFVVVTANVMWVTLVGLCGEYYTPI